MAEIFSITLPIFLIIGLGYLSIDRGVFQKSEMRTLGTYVLMVALPALIIRAFGQRPLAELLDLRYLLACGLGSMAVFFVGLGLVRGVLKQPMSEAAMGALGMSCSNSGYIGYPLAALVVGPMAGLALALNILIENIIMIPLGLGFAEAGANQHQTWAARLHGVARGLAKSPMIVAIAVGMTISLLEIRLPPPLWRTVDMLAMASGPVALFVIGASLHGIRMAGMAGHLGIILVGKLVLHPLAVAGGLWLFPVASADLQVAALLLAAVPMLSIFPILGQRFGLEKLCAAALLGSTVAAFGTLSGLLWLIQNHLAH